LLLGLGGRFSRLARAVERHAINCVLTGPAPATAEEQVVFLADKLVGMCWMGFRARVGDILDRYGDRYDVRSALPGTEQVFIDLAARACLYRGDLERMVGAAVTGVGGVPWLAGTGAD
jgi:hypothetical protein